MRVLITFVAFCCVGSGQPNRHIISERLARKLAIEALSTVVAMDGLNIKPWQYYWAPEFYTFQAWRPGIPDPQGVGVLETHYLAVNPWTGDVWDAMGCERITSPAFAKEQDAIWRRSKLPNDVRLAIRDKAPADCSVRAGPNIKDGPNQTPKSK